MKQSFGNGSDKGFTQWIVAGISWKRIAAIAEELDSEYVSFLF
jgi:hypothetical protein